MRPHSIRQIAFRSCVGICSALVPIMAAQALAAQPPAAQNGTSATEWPAPSPLHDKVPQANEAGLLRITVINLSGKNREAVVRNAVIDLPVATPVVLQMHAGEAFQVRSDTDSKFRESRVITESDQTRIIAVQ